MSYSSHHTATETAGNPESLDCRHRSIHTSL